MIRKFRTLLLLFLFTTLAVNAQKNIGIYGYPTIDFSNFKHTAFNYSAGIKSHLKLSKKYILILSLGYENKKYNSLQYGITTFDEIVPDYYDARLIKVSGLFRVNLTKRVKKLIFYAFAGPSLNTCLYEKTNLSKNATIHLHSVFIAAGFGGSLWFKKISVDIEPTFETRVMQNTKNLALNYEFSSGINFGITYHFKKPGTGCNCD